MNLFVRSVVQGFGMALGAALFKKIQDRLGLGEAKDEKLDDTSSSREQAPPPPPPPEPDLRS
jgi:hypothetical protein